MREQNGESAQTTTLNGNLLLEFERRAALFVALFAVLLALKIAEHVQRESMHYIASHWSTFEEVTWTKFFDNSTLFAFKTFGASDSRSDSRLEILQIL